ncbi:HAD family hydrolase [Spongisporangium articulatum]|uniref:HAD family hydrolase n=1 Tax=Spongisporangium articulatum TaxID=3362603 RepID=A0ABW8AI42_9ACTN
MSAPLTVGFDLDMTLVDSAAGIVATFQAAFAEIPGAPALTRDDVWPYIGIPLRATVEALAPQLDADEAVAHYRTVYPTLGARMVQLLPGALDAIAAVRSAGGRVLVISAKTQAGVEEVLTTVGLHAGPHAPDLVVGDLFAGAKGVRLKLEDATVYVGDHPGDVEAARVASALAVAVATGPTSSQALHEAGADVVLPDLTAFPSWLASTFPA